MFASNEYGVCRVHGRLDEWRVYQRATCKGRTVLLRLYPMNLASDRAQEVPFKQRLTSTRPGKL
jgi:hypothetical protein